jgi:predicted transcriptional regulator
MIAMVKVLSAFLFAVLLCEILLLNRRKIQSRFAPILVVHALIFCLMLLLVLKKGEASIVSAAIFWMGAFLTWFGMRSHLESSILLRMLYLLKKRSMKPGQLLEEYEQHYGEALRIEELVHSGLIRKDDQRFELTQKGRLILAAVIALR